MRGGRTELCRNFQRGSCHYGDRCKFLHVSQQQSKLNPFGFGVPSGASFNKQEQQQRPNPFGFGVQSSPNADGPSSFSSKYQHQVKPFENKWTRATSATHGNSTRQNDTQPPQGVNHKCLDPESCKHLIAEDLQNERPLWKLTCYGHARNRPCDISGDVSYEELRAAAYEDARQGMPLQTIVERERSLLHSKLIEFENLLRSPYVLSPNPTSSVATTFPGTAFNASLNVVQNNNPPTVSSFSQLGKSLGSGFSPRPPAPSNNFGQPSTFQISSQTSGAFGSQLPMHSFGNAPSSNFVNFNSSASNVGSNQHFSSVASPHLASNANSQFPSIVNRIELAASGAEKASINELSVDDKKTGVALDTSIWLREWKRGEIPEEPPPDEFI